MSAVIGAPVMTGGLAAAVTASSTDTGWATVVVAGLLGVLFLVVVTVLAALALGAAAGRRRDDMAAACDDDGTGTCPCTPPAGIGDDIHRDGITGPPPRDAVDDEIDQMIRSWKRGDRRG